MPQFPKFLQTGPGSAEVANVTKRKIIQIPLAEKRGLLSTCAIK